MIEEVRRQFREDAGILAGTTKPDYAGCVSISTGAALKEMIAPGLLAIIAPLAVGFILGPEALGGMLAGALAAPIRVADHQDASQGPSDEHGRGHHRGPHC